MYWIGRWASNLIYKYSTEEFDYTEKFKFTYDILAKLEFLCEGKSFAMSYEELDQLADELILAREIELK